jgi:hypothetical protein
MLTTEAAISLLQSTLQSSVGDIFRIIGRRHILSSEIPEYPALYITHFANEDEWTGGGLVRTTLDLRLYIYATTTDKDIPDTILNGLVAQLAQAFTPDDEGSGEFTINGSVSWVRIEGRTEFYPGDLTDQAIAVVPVRIRPTM